MSPPSTPIREPVTKEAGSPQRNAATAANSSGRPYRPAGIPRCSTRHRFDRRQMRLGERRETGGQGRGGQPHPGLGDQSAPP